MAQDATCRATVLLALHQLLQNILTARVPVTNCAERLVLIEVIQAENVRLPAGW